MDVFQSRKVNLSSLISEKFEGNRAAFCRYTGKNPNLINLALTDNTDLARRIGEKLARDIEKKMGLPSGWLDLPRGGEPTAMLSIPFTRNPAMIIDGERPLQTLTLEQSEITPYTRGASSPRNVIIVPAEGDAMQPTISPGDFVFVDISVNVADRDGIYLVGEKSPAIRRIQRADDAIRLIADNTIYPAITPQKEHEPKVVGRVLTIMKFKPLL